MADFHENMKAFTNRLQTSIDDRGESLAGVHQATTDLIDAARMFMDGVAQEHQARAEDVRAFMARSRADRDETVQSLREKHREDLASMSESLRSMLQDNVKVRTEAVSEFMAASHAERCESSRLMRESHREELARMSEGLRQTLDDANAMRLETVGAMRQGFREARVALATDLRGASTAWRQFSTRQMKSPMSPMPEPVVEVQVMAPVAEPEAKVPPRPKGAHPQKTRNTRRRSSSKESTHS